MALWRYTVRLPDGTERENVLGAGNLSAAQARAERNAAARGGVVVAGPVVVDRVRGSM